MFVLRLSLQTNYLVYQVRATEQYFMWFPMFLDLLQSEIHCSFVVVVVLVDLASDMIKMPQLYSLQT